MNGECGRISGVSDGDFMEDLAGIPPGSDGRDTPHSTGRTGGEHRNGKWNIANFYVVTALVIKEDRDEVTLGILIKIPPNLLLDLSLITLGRIELISKFIFLCLQNMVSGQQVEYINLLRPSHPHDLHIGQDLTFKVLLSIQAFFMAFTIIF